MGIRFSCDARSCHSPSTARSREAELRLDQVPAKALPDGWRPIEIDNPISQEHIQLLACSEKCAKEIDAGVENQVLHFFVEGAKRVRLDMERAPDAPERTRLPKDLLSYARCAMWLAARAALVQPKPEGGPADVH